MDILEFIPSGHKNAVSRRHLRYMTGLNDRDIREQINKMRKQSVILNLQDGKGYFVFDPATDMEYLKRFVRQETKRRDAIDQYIIRATEVLDEL